MKVFECKKCGRCCAGKGGIVLSPKDLGRLAAFMDMDEAMARESFTEISNGKLKIRSDNGHCIFFRPGQGCGVHEAKPDICRAWPFFRGNLIDRISLSMAREFCPGINPGASFEDFVEDGLAYLKEGGLVAMDGAHEANALIIQFDSRRS